MGKILSIAGLERSGKDSVGDYLVEHHGFQKDSFAAPLKEACRAIFGLDDRHLFGDLKEEMHPFWKTTPRDILQRVGTEAFRNGFDQDVWIKSLQYRLQGKAGFWVISDARFINEVEAIKSWGGKVYRVDRPGIESAIATNQHTSETALNDYNGWDGVISNAGSLPDLYAETRRVLGLP